MRFYVGKEALEHTSTLYFLAKKAVAEGYCTVCMDKSEKPASRIRPHICTKLGLHSPVI